MIWAFDPFRLDEDRRELCREGIAVQMEPQLFDLLCYLIRHQGRVVTRDDLFAGVWGGRIVADSTLSSRIALLRQALGDDGRRQALLRTIPRKGYRFVGAASPAASNRAVRPPEALAQPDTATIAVPMLRVDPDAPSHLAEGIADDIAAGLSRFRTLTVYRTAMAEPVREGAGYSVNGSLRRDGTRLRLAVRLVEADQGRMLWADHFDAAQGDAFALRDDLVARVIRAVAPRVEAAEAARARRRLYAIPAAYDLYQRGLSHIYRWTADGMDAALRDLAGAMALDPEFSPALGAAAYCHVQRQSSGWSTDRAADGEACRMLVDHVWTNGSGDAVALARAAHAAAYVMHDVDLALELAGRAVTLNPHASTPWLVSAWVQVFNGAPEAGLEHAQRALEAGGGENPIDFKVHGAQAYASFFLGRIDEAAQFAERALRRNPTYLTALRGAAASHALAGRRGAAEALVARLPSIVPLQRLSSQAELFPLRGPGHLRQWEAGLRRAGLRS